MIHLSATKSHRLIENGEGIPHSSIRLSGYHVQTFIRYADILLRSYIPEVPDYIRNTYAVEIISLTTRQDSRYNLMFLSGTKYENGVGRRLFQSLEEGIESLL